MFKRGVRAQEAEEFDRVFCALLPRLYRRARLLTNEGIAEDAVHEAYLKLSGKPQRFLAHPEPYAYAFCALVSVLRDGWRRNSGRFTSTLVVEDIEDIAGHSGGGIRRREAELEAVRLLSKLSRRQAAAVLLVDLDGYTLDQAAEFLGVHRGTVARARARALALLRAELETETVGNGE